MGPARFDILPDSCQHVVESSAQRVIHLASQWEKHRVPLLAEYRHLRKLQDCREVGGRVLSGDVLLPLGAVSELCSLPSVYGFLAAGIISTAGRNPGAAPECSSSCRRGSQEGGGL